VGLKDFDPDGTPPPAPVVDKPPVIRVLHSQSGGTATQLENSTTTNNWYKVTIDGEVAVPGLDYVINDSGKVTVELGPNNDFKLKDNNPADDDSGFYISVTSNKTNERPLTSRLPVYYRDDAGNTQGATIILNGGPRNGKATTIALNVGETYVEYGASAITKLGAPISVKAYGTVDTNTAGVNTIIYVATDNSGKTVTTTRAVIVKDSDVPVISLNGADVTLALNTPYVDQGASATDSSDGDLSSLVTTQQYVNNTVAGTYYVYYSVTDFAGNTAVARRAVVVQ